MSDETQDKIILLKFLRIAHKAILPVDRYYLCKSLRVDGRHLSRICQERLKMGPIEYVNSERLHKARKDLQEGILTVEQIMLKFRFTHRFFQMYSNKFGELPNATTTLGYIERGKVLGLCNQPL